MQPKRRRKSDAGKRTWASWFTEPGLLLSEGKPFFTEKNALSPWITVPALSCSQQAVSAGSFVSLPLKGHWTMPGSWPHQHKAVCWFQFALIKVVMGHYAPSQGVRLPTVVWSLKRSLSTGCGSRHSVWYFWKICMISDDEHSPDIWGWGSSEQMLVFWVASPPFSSPIHSLPPEVALCHMGVWHTAGGAVQLAFTFMCKPARKHFYSYWPRFLLPMTNHCWATGVSITAFKCCRPVFSKVYLCFF